MKPRVTFTEHLRIHDTMSGEDRSLRARLFRLGTALVEPFYTAAVTLRNKLYDWGILRTHRVHLPVISVGNITTGGTGKTPMVIYIVKLLQQHGYKPAVILRGYRGGAHGSDEAKLLTDALSSVPVLSNPDRVAAARGFEDDDNVDVIVLDDAFQHRRIYRDADVVLVDASCPFGFGHMLPRGMLRETSRGLRRADAVIVTRSNLIDDEARRHLIQRIECDHGTVPIAHAAHVWTAIVDSNDRVVDTSDTEVLAIAGIGNPEPFFAEARKRCNVTATMALPDHFDWHGEAMLRRLYDQLETRMIPADAILTTEKDWVKMRADVYSPETEDDQTPIWRPRMELKLLDGADALEKLILDAVRGRSGSA